MSGPWATALVAAVGGDLPSAAPVRGLAVEAGTVTALVEDCTVTLTAPRIPPRIWTAMSRYAKNKGALEAAVSGLAQSAHLAQLMQEDWGEPLVPDAAEIGRSCTCDHGAPCEHVAAVAHAFAAEIERDPAALLRWRGCSTAPPVEDDAEEPELHLLAGSDPWRGGPLPESRAAQPLRVASMLKRLGPSGIRVGDADLADVLERAYEAFAQD